MLYLGFPCGSAGKESACNEGDLSSIPGLGRSPGERKGYPVQYSGLENSGDCIVHGVTKSRAWLSNFHYALFVSSFYWNNSICPITLDYFMLFFLIFWHEYFASFLGFSSLKIKSITATDFHLSSIGFQNKNSSSLLSWYNFSLISCLVEEFPKVMILYIHIIQILVIFFIIYF